DRRYLQSRWPLMFSVGTCMAGIFATVFTVKPPPEQMTSGSSAPAFIGLLWFAWLVMAAVSVRLAALEQRRTGPRTAFVMICLTILPLPILAGSTLLTGGR